MGDSERLLKPQRLPFSAADPAEDSPLKGGVPKALSYPAQGSSPFSAVSEGLVLFIHIPDVLQVMKTQPPLIITSAKWILKNVKQCRSLCAVAG